MITILYGNEPYLVHHQLKELTSDGGFTRFQEFSSETINTLWTDSLFGTPKVIVELMHIKELSKDFFVYAKDENKSATLVVVIKEMDNKHKAYKELMTCENVKMVSCDKLSEEKLKRFVLSIMKKNERVIKPSTLEFLLDRADYDSPDCTLYRVGNMVQSICSASGVPEIQTSLIDALYPEKRAVNKFHVAELIDRMDKRALLKTAKVLTETEGAIPFLSILYREFRIAYKARFFTPAQIGVRMCKNFSGWSEENLIRAMEVIGSTIEKQKSNLMSEEICIAYVFHKLIEIREVNTNEQ